MIESSSNTTIMVPAYNEETGLPIVLKKIFGIIDDTYEVLVIDDASKDNTSREAANFPCKLVKHEINKGKGQAIITGIREAKGQNIVSIDADDTYQCEAIPQIVAALNDYDIAIGSRFYGKEHIPSFNRVGNFFIRSLIKIVYGFKPHDPLTGLWGVRKAHALKILPESRYAPDAEMWMKACRMNLTMYDIHTIYAPRVGQSKLPPIKAGWEHLKLIWKFRNWESDGNVL